MGVRPCQLPQMQAHGAIPHEAKEEFLHQFRIKGADFFRGNVQPIAQATSAGAVLSFSLPNYDIAKAFVEAMKIPVFAVSLGGVESILSYPAKMSHAAMEPEERSKRGITDGLLRFSVGLENEDDLIEDFTQALEIANKIK